MEEKSYKNTVLSIPAIFSVNEATTFSNGTQKALVYIGYPGDNRNGSSISKEVFEKMIPGLYGCPIVGEFDEKKGDFLDHGDPITLSNNGVVGIRNAHAYGYVDSQATVSWVSGVEAKNPDREYLTVEVELWTEYFKEARKLLEGNNNQSMEIRIKDGYMREDGIFEITDAQFLSLCILGEDIIPAFEAASIQKYNLGKQFNENKTKEKGGGANSIMDKELEMIKEENAELETRVAELEEIVVVKDDEIASLIAENAELVEVINSLGVEVKEDEPMEEVFAAIKTISEELQSLRTFKSEAEKEEIEAKVDEVFEEFNVEALVEAEIITEEELEALKAEVVEGGSIEDLEKELSYIVVKNKVAFNVNEDEDKGKEDNVDEFSINVNLEDIDSKPNPYGSLAKYAQK